jgi:hypothetical protein
MCNGKWSRQHAHNFSKEGRKKQIEFQGNFQILPALCAQLSVHGADVHQLL